MSSPGRTKKPCESCGKPDRPTGDICRDCHELIDEALDERKRQKNLPQRTSRRHHQTAHWNPSYYDGDGEHEHCDRLRAAMTRLVFAVGEIARGQKQAHDTPSLLKRYKRPGSKLYSSSRAYDSLLNAPTLLFTTEQVAAFVALDHAIRDLHISATEEAFAHGSDLLRRLGEGDLALTDFEERQKRYSE